MKYSPILFVLAVAAGCKSNQERVRLPELQVQQITPADLKQTDADVHEQLRLKALHICSDAIVYGAAANRDASMLDQAFKHHKLCVAAGAEEAAFAAAHPKLK